MSNRQKTQEFIYRYIGDLTGPINVGLYKKKFSNMSDEEFDYFMKDLRDGKQRLCVIDANFGTERLSVKKNIEVAKELGKSLFQKIWVSSEPGKPAYLTPNEYIVTIMPLRRQAQLLSKKVSIPEDNNSVDDFTGQPTGKSKGSKISYPETQVLASFGLNKSIIELLKYRGGDERGFAAMNTMIDRTGSVNLKAIEPYAGGVKSTQTLKSLMTAMHFNVTI
jgi:hypothetical protein